MGSKFRNTIHVFAAITFILTSSMGNDTHAERVGRNEYGSLEFVVTVDGKHFYANHKYRQNFLESSEYCREHGLELASVQNKMQYYRLMIVLKRVNNYGYWTSATLSKKPSMFIWKDTGKLLEAEEIPLWQSRWLRRTYCVIIYNSDTASNPAGLYVVDCSSEQPVLCQTSSILK